MPYNSLIHTKAPETEMTDEQTKTQAILDTYWKPKFRGNETLADTLREVVFQLQYYNTSEGEDMILNARDILDLCDELENIEND